MKERIKSKIKVDEKKITRCAPTTILPTIGKISPSENRTLIDYHVCQDDDDFHHRLSYIFVKTIITLIIIDIMFAKMMMMIIDYHTYLSRRSSSSSSSISWSSLQGLAFLHDLRIVHLDVKPYNILFCNKVTFFWLCSWWSK